jgi:hypothetical protein
MRFEDRLRLAEQLLQEAAVEGQDLILFGSGVWFASLERALGRALARYTAHVSVSQVNPLLRATFLSGGSIQCIDLESGQNLHMIDDGSSRVPGKAYLVEDGLGVNAKVWEQRVKPFLKRGECTVIYLGNAQDAKSS